MSIPIFVFASFCCAAGIADTLWRRIPNVLNVGGASLGLLACFLHGNGMTILLSIAGLGLGLLVMLPLYAKGILGAGDVKFNAAVGAWLGPSGVLTSTLWGFVGGGVLCGIILLIAGRQFRSTVTTNIYQIINGNRQAAMASTAQRPLRQRVPLAVALATAALLTAFLNGSVYAS
jgi:prepilin peptidase CpaA